MYQMLETTFGARGARTVGTRIAQKFYMKLGLTLHNHEGYKLPDYVEEAKPKLGS